MSDIALNDEKIDNQIVETQFHQFPGTTVTVCCLELRNGFNVVGESACVDPDDFDEELGREIAFKDARERIWELEGYRMKQRLHDMTESVGC